MLSSASRQTGLQRSRPAIRIPTVCIVDPQADDYLGWDSLARENGTQLEVVASAEAALRLAATTTVDLWVVNTQLPGLSGCELCRMLKAQFPTAAVYLVAKEHSPELEREAWAARASMFGCKGAHAEWLDLWLQARRDRVTPTRVGRATISN